MGVAMGTCAMCKQRSGHSFWEFNLFFTVGPELNSGHQACMQALLFTKPSHSTLNWKFLEQDLSIHKNLECKITEMMSGEAMPGSASITWKIGKHKEKAGL